MSTMIAGCGFARMAWELAQKRTHESGAEWPMQRWQITYRHQRWPSAEFYRIIDRATASWHAFAGERSAGICPRVGL